MEYNIPRGTRHLFLKDNNYLAWAISVKSYMIARGYGNVIEGSYPKPKTEMKDGKAVEPLDSEVNEWEMADRRAWCDIASLCNEADWMWYKPETAKELWDRLERTKKPRKTTRKS